LAEANPYPTPGGVEAAIKDAAKKASAIDPSLTAGERIRMAYFDRFLSRVFSEGDQSEWLLKGGIGMLARVPSTRATGDIDLYRNGFTLNQAVADLRRQASIDLGDHFTFAYVGAKAITAVDSQPYTEGYHVNFDVQIGLKRMGTLGIDLVVGPGVTSEVTTVEPANRLSLPRLISNPYRLFPIADQIADKVCATMTIFGSRSSTREKDLVDLVVIAVTHDIDGTALGHAITTEARRRKMQPINHFSVPSTWGVSSAKLAKPIPHCADFPTVALAAELVARFIDPALDGTANGGAWSHQHLAWS